MTTNVPKLRFTDRGIIAPLEADILKGRLDDINKAFGGGLNRNLETPQGQIASSDTAIIADMNSFFIDLVNQINPDYAQGIMQDAIAKIYFLTRKQGTSSTVTCRLTGLAGTIIRTGFLASDDNGNFWALTYDTQIPQSGSINALFNCTVSGPINAPSGTITNIYQAVIGLDRIINEVDAVPGQDIENRQDFAYRRQNSVAINSVGTPQAVYGNVFGVENVSDVFVYHNVQDVEVTYGVTSYKLAPHSIYVAAVGGDNYAIANAIWERSGNGCNYNGNTEVIVYDMLYDQPRPEYKVLFNRPTQTQIYFDVVVEQNSNSSNASVQEIRTIIIDAFYGKDGLARCRIGGRVRATRFTSAIIAKLQNINLISLKVGFNATVLTDFVDLGIDQYPAVSDFTINVSFEALP